MLNDVVFDRLFGWIILEPAGGVGVSFQRPRLTLLSRGLFGSDCSQVLGKTRKFKGHSSYNYLRRLTEDSAVWVSKNTLSSKRHFP